MSVIVRAGGEVDDRHRPGCLVGDEAEVAARHRGGTERIAAGRDDADGVGCEVDDRRGVAEVEGHEQAGPIAGECELHRPVRGRGGQARARRREGLGERRVGGQRERDRADLPRLRAVIGPGEDVHHVAPGPRQRVLRRLPSGVGQPRHVRQPPRGVERDPARGSRQVEDGAHLAGGQVDDADVVGGDAGGDGPQEATVIGDGTAHGERAERDLLAGRGEQASAGLQPALGARCGEWKRQRGRPRLRLQVRTCRRSSHRQAGDDGTGAYGDEERPRTCPASSHTPRLS